MTTLFRVTSQPPLKYHEIKQVAQTVLSTLSQCDIQACLIGSMAAICYGAEHRTPNDVDLLVLNPPNGQGPEEIKTKLVSANPAFVLIPSKKPGAAYNVLWYTFPPEPVKGRAVSDSGVQNNCPSSRSGLNISSTHSLQRPRGSQGPHSARKRGPLSPSDKKSPPLTQSTTHPLKACKVDILTPGELKIPPLPPSALKATSELCFESYSDPSAFSVPSLQAATYPSYLLLIILKLAAWKDHSALTADEKSHNHVPQDEADIEELLRLAGVLPYEMLGLEEARAQSWVLGSFECWQDVRNCVVAYTKKWPRSAKGWALVGIL